MFIALETMTLYNIYSGYPQYLTCCMGGKHTLIKQQQKQKTYIDQTTTTTKTYIDQTTITTKTYIDQTTTKTKIIK